MLSIVRKRARLVIGSGLAALSRKVISEEDEEYEDRIRHQGVICHPKTSGFCPMGQAIRIVRNYKQKRHAFLHVSVAISTMEF